MFNLSRASSNVSATFFSTCSSILLSKRSPVWHASNFSILAHIVWIIFMRRSILASCNLDLSGSFYCEIQQSLRIHWMWIPLFSRTLHWASDIALHVLWHQFLHVWHYGLLIWAIAFSHYSQDQRVWAPFPYAFCTPLFLLLLLEVELFLPGSGRGCGWEHIELTLIKQNSTHRI